MDRLGLGYVKLTGAVPTPKRGELIDRFFKDPDCRVFLSSDAGGVGLNLQAASLVVNLDLPWNPAVLEQRIARAHRHGQRHTVHVINLVAKETIEERMLDTLAAKREVFAGVFGGDDAATEIRFEDTGQSLMQQLDDMLQVSPVQVKLELAPQAAALDKDVAQPVEVLAPTLRDYADLLVGRFPGRILLVRPAPQLPGAASDGNVLVVVDKAPGQIRPVAEKMLAEHFAPAPPIPGLHLMEQEGYRALLALTGGLLEQIEPETEADVYRAPAMPAPTGSSVREKITRRLKKAREGFDQAARRLQLARVVLSGGFPEELLRPVREALGWALSSHLALIQEHTPDVELPNPRLLHAELVETKRLSAELAGQVARVRELTAPPADDKDPGPPPSLEAGDEFIAAVQTLIDRGQELAVEAGL